MKESFTGYLPFVPLAIVPLWLGITTLLCYRSGWFDLMKVYPDRDDPVAAKFPRLSGTLNGVSMRNILRAQICTTGLRLGLMRVFGPFCRDVFVPWDALSVTRTQHPLVGKIALVALGQPAIALLKLPAEVADDLARAASGHWPEAGPFEAETRRQAGARLFREWALQTAMAALFFIVAPRLMTQRSDALPPIALAILFPATVFGIGSLIRYWRRSHG